MGDKNNVALTKEQLMKRTYSPAISNNLLDDIIVMQGKTTSVETHKDGKYIIRNREEISVPASTAVLKMLDTAIAYLTWDDIYNRIAKTENGKLLVDPEIEIPLIAYGEANGFKLRTEHFNDQDLQQKENIRAQQTRKFFRNQIKETLQNMLGINVYYNSTDDKKFSSGYIISWAETKKYAGIEYIHLNFDVGIARTLLASPKMQYSWLLLQHNNKNQNAYAIGRYIARHASIDNNIKQGTANTAKVSTLLSKTHGIPSIEEVRSSKHGWTDRIKMPFETAMNENVNINFLTDWSYRDSQTGEVFSSEELSAKPLQFEDFIKLYIDYKLTPNSYQDYRFEQISTNKQSAKHQIDTEANLPF